MIFGNRHRSQERRYEQRYLDSAALLGLQLEPYESLNDKSFLFKIDKTFFQNLLCHQNKLPQSPKSSQRRFYDYNEDTTPLCIL